MNPRLWLAIHRMTRRKAIAEREAERRRDCPRCNPTARAMERVRELWVAAGIDLGE